MISSSDIARGTSVPNSSVATNPRGTRWTLSRNRHDFHQTNHTKNDIFVRDNEPFSNLTVLMHRNIATLLQF
jgi:hypothetical protein